MLEDALDLQDEDDALEVIEPFGNSQRMQRYEVVEEDKKEEDEEDTNIEWMA